MYTPVFLSYPKPFMEKQKYFIEGITKYLKKRGFDPRTLEVIVNDQDSVLQDIKNMMLECEGIIVIAFRRTLINSAVQKPKSDMGMDDTKITGEWLTSTWCQIEIGMAFQKGIPILNFQETGVMCEGVLNYGTSSYDSKINLEESIDEYLKSNLWEHVFKEWEKEVCKMAINR